MSEKTAFTVKGFTCYAGLLDKIKEEVKQLLPHDGTKQATEKALNATRKEACSGCYKTSSRFQRL